MGSPLAPLSDRPLPPLPVPSPAEEPGISSVIQVSSPLPNAESESVKQASEKTTVATKAMKKSAIKKEKPQQTVKKNKIVAAKVAAKAAKSAEKKKKYNLKKEHSVGQDNKNRWQFLKNILNFLFRRSKTKTPKIQTVSGEQVKGLNKPKDKEFPPQKDLNFVESRAYQDPTNQTEEIQHPSPGKSEEIQTKDDKKIAKLKKKEAEKTAKEAEKTAKLEKKEAEKNAKQIEPYHYIIKQMQARVDFYEMVAADPSIFRESASVSAVKDLIKNYKNKSKIENAHLRELAALTKTLVFSEMPMSQFQALQLDVTFNEMQKENKSPGDIAKVLKEKINTLTPFEKEFLKDLVKLIDTTYTKSWSPRPGMVFSNMVQAMPNLGKIFDHENTPPPATLEEASTNKQVNIGITLFPFLIQHQAEIFA